MGKIAERLKRRKSPEHALVRYIVKAAAATAVDPDETSDALDDLIEQALQLHSPAQFHDLIGHVYEEAEARPDADELLDEVVFSVQRAVEMAQDDSECADYLLALPLYVTHDKLAWQLSLSADQAQAAAQALKEHALVNEDAQITVLPQLLSPGQADHIREGAAFRLTRLLAAGNAKGASDLLTKDLDEQGVVVENQAPAGAASAPATTSFGVLVAVVRACYSDVDVFPLAMQKEHAFLETGIHDDDGNDPDPEIDAKINEIIDDVRGVLNAAGPDLARAIGATELRVLREPDGWYEGVTVACHQQRETGVILQLRQLAESHTQGDVSQLRSGDDIRHAGANFELDVHRKSDLSVVGRIQWQPLLRESQEESLEALEMVLEREQVGHVDEAGLERRQTEGPWRLGGDSKL